MPIQKDGEGAPSLRVWSQTLDSNLSKRDQSSSQNKLEIILFQAPDNQNKIIFQFCLQIFYNAIEN